MSQLCAYSSSMLDMEGVKVEYLRSEENEGVKAGRPMEEGLQEGGWHRFWHLPDEIVQSLAVPEGFEAKLKAFLASLEPYSICDRELLLRVLVHESYYYSLLPHIAPRPLPAALMESALMESPDNEESAAAEMPPEAPLTFAAAHSHPCRSGRSWSSWATLF